MVVDFYAMLVVNPGADQAEIEAALARCQPTWSAGTRNPKTKHTYQSYLDQIPAIRRTLLADPAARASYDAELQAANRIERDGLLDQLHRLVRLRSAKGGLTVSDRTLLRVEAVRLKLRPEDLDQLIEGIPPLPETPTAAEDAQEPAPDVIEPAMRRQIAVALDHLRRRDLYHVLEVARDASTAEIMARADEQRKRWMRKSQVTADKTAWLEAISYAQSHLGTAPARARYDRTLAFEAEEVFIASAQFALKGLARLDPGTEAVVRDESSRQGIAPDRAEILYRRICRECGVATHTPLVGGSRQQATRSLRCRSCSGITALLDPDAPGVTADCRFCSSSLRWICPACQASLWVDQPRCSCGFLLENLDPYRRHLEAARAAYRSRLFDEALEHLEQVRLIAPRNRAWRLASARIQKRQAEVLRLQAAWEIERDRGRLVSARRTLDTWARLVPPQESAYQSALTETHRRLGEAARMASEAHHLAIVEPARARALYLSSLSLAADLPEALDGLLRCPPDPPRSVEAVWAGDHVAISWSPPAPDHLGPLTYLVTRKTGDAPGQPGEGKLLGEFSETVAADADLLPGETYYYAVWSRRSGIDSLSLVAAQPVQALPEVGRLDYESSRTEVTLRWSLHPRAAGARVTRLVGRPPASSAEGTPLPCAREGLRDREVEEGQSYFYLIEALYRAASGQLLPSAGVTLNVVPAEPLRPIESLDIAAGADGRSHLTWVPPARGSVRILRSSKSPGIEPATALEAAELESFEGDWIEPIGSDQAELPMRKEGGLQFFTPFTNDGSKWLAGQTITDIDLPDPADLRAARVGSDGKYHLRWRWPSHASQCLVLARSGTSPEGATDPEALAFTVSEAEYSRRGFFTITVPADVAGPWHIVALAVTFHDDQKFLSSGRGPSCRLVLPGPHPEVTVSYSLRPPRLPGRSWSISLRTDPPGQEIPPLALVLHARTVPLSAEDGELIDRFPASRDGAVFRVRTRRNLGDHRLRIFTDPHSDPGSLPPVRLRHPEVGTPRI